MRAWIKAAVVALGLVGAVAQAAELTEVRVGYTSIVPETLVAKEKGWIEEALKPRGVSVKWVESLGSNKTIEFLRGKSLDIGPSSTASALLARANGTPIKYVYWTARNSTGSPILVLKDSPYKTVADLKGKTIAITTGTTNQQVVRKYSADQGLDIQIDSAKDHADAFLMVETGRADAFAMDDVLLFGLIANSRTPHDYAVVGTPLQVEPYACMLRKDDPRFKTLVDGTIGHMMKSGEFTRLYTRWFMQPIPPRNVRINMPMGPQLKANLRNLSDRPAT